MSFPFSFIHKYLRNNNNLQSLYILYLDNNFIITTYLKNYCIVLFCSLYYYFVFSIKINLIQNKFNLKKRQHI